MSRKLIASLLLAATVLVGFGATASADEVVVREHVVHPHRVVVVRHRHHYHHPVVVERVHPVHHDVVIEAR